MLDCFNTRVWASVKAQAHQAARAKPIVSSIVIYKHSMCVGREIPLYVDFIIRKAINTTDDQDSQIHALLNNGRDTNLIQ